MINLLYNSLIKSNNNDKKKEYYIKKHKRGMVYLLYMLYIYREQDIQKKNDIKYCLILSKICKITKKYIK